MIKKGPEQRERYNYSPFACRRRQRNEWERGGGLQLNAQNSAGSAEEETAGDGSRAGTDDWLEEERLSRGRD